MVSIIGEACLRAGILDPIIVTESGRALAAYHSVLITEVIDVASNEMTEGSGCKSFPLLETLQVLENELTAKNAREAYNDLMDIKERIIEEFTYGNILFKQRAVAEKSLKKLLRSVQGYFKQLSPRPDELDILDDHLKETYFCNFSLFQSLPDSWAIGHLFP